MISWTKKNATIKSFPAILSGSIIGQGRLNLLSTILCIALFFAVLILAPLRPLGRGLCCAQERSAGIYLQHADREEQVMMPMRDGVRLSALILFPKDRPRQNLPAILFRSPYLIDPGEINRFAEYLESFLKNGYAAISRMFAAATSPREPTLTLSVREKMATTQSNGSLNNPGRMAKSVH